MKDTGNDPKTYLVCLLLGTSLALVPRISWAIDTCESQFEMHNTKERPLLGQFRGLMWTAIDIKSGPEGIGYVVWARLRPETSSSAKSQRDKSYSPEDTLRFPTLAYGVRGAGALGIFGFGEVYSFLSAEASNWYIDRFNQQLDPSSPYRMQVRSSSEFERIPKHLRTAHYWLTNFFLRDKWPRKANGHLFYHDGNLHDNNSIPLVFRQLVKNQTRLAVSFSEWLKINHPESFKRKVWKHIVQYDEVGYQKIQLAFGEAFLSDLLEEIDFGGGNYFASLSREMFAPHPSQPMLLTRKHLAVFTGNFLTPYGRLRYLLDKNNFPAKDYVLLKDFLAGYRPDFEVRQSAWPTRPKDIDFEVYVHMSAVIENLEKIAEREPDRFWWRH